MLLTLELAKPLDVCELNKLGCHMPPYRDFSLLVCDLTLEQDVESLHAPLTVSNLLASSRAVELSILTAGSMSSLTRCLLAVLRSS